MKKTDDRDETARKFLKINQIATISELKATMETEATMTVFRSLTRLGYRTSYSDRGRYYTLLDIPDFDEYGLWSCRTARFSRFGNLLETVAALIERSRAGANRAELEAILQVEAKHALLQLIRRKKIARFKSGRSFVYMSGDAGEQRRQRLTRSDRNGHQEAGAGLETEALSDEMRAGIILFFSLLDEKQRRLYAGLEAAKMGFGGNQKAADLLGLDPHTVAKGREELFGGNVERGRVRKAGGGDKLTEKKTAADR